MLYVPLLAYQAYEGIVVSLYQEEPVILTQYYLVRDGIPFLLENLHLPLHVCFGAAILVLGAGWFVVHMLRWLREASAPRRLGRGSLLTVNTLAVAAVVTALAFQPTQADSVAVVNSTILKVRRNLSASFALHRAIADIKPMGGEESSLVEDEQRLATKPNIYLIFIESYGSVLYARPDYDAAYRALLAQLKPNLLPAVGTWRRP